VWHRSTIAGQARYERYPTHRDKSPCGIVKPIRRLTVGCVSSVRHIGPPASRMPDAPKAPAYLTGACRQALPASGLARRHRKSRPAHLCAMLWGTNQSCVEYESMVAETGGPAACVAVTIAVRQGFGRAWHGRCNKRFTAKALPPGSDARGSSGWNRPAANKDFVSAAGEANAFLRGCGGAIEKRMSIKRGELPIYKYRSFATGRREARPRHFFHPIGRTRSWSKRQTSRSSGSRATRGTGKGQRTARTSRREEAGRNGLEPS